MEAYPLPLAPDRVPEALRRFVATDAPGPARMMAARGMVPLKGADLLLVLFQLSADADEKVAAAAKATLTGLPDNVRDPALEACTEPSVLAAAAETFASAASSCEILVANAATPGAAIATIASRADDRLCELIAINQGRVLESPEILTALYKNKRARMSTIDRLVEFTARHGVVAPGLPAFQLHAEALAGQLIPEPSDEILPTDELFTAAIEADSSNHEVVEVPEGSDGEAAEKLRDEFKPLAFRIREMSTAEKIRFAIVGDAAARALLVRDPKKVVFLAAISSPSMTESEAASVAHSKEVAVDVLRYISNRKEWLKSYDIKRALLFNPKSPIDISMKFLTHMRASDLKSLSQSRGVANQVKVMARQRLDQMQKKQ